VDVSFATFGGVSLACSASPEMLCTKLTTNMSHQQWRDWVSPDIDYITLCPDLPVADPGN
jgi:hypothetical protein